MRVIIHRQGRSLSDFASEKDALQMLAGELGYDIAFEEDIIDDRLEVVYKEKTYELIKNFEHKMFKKPANAALYYKAFKADYPNDDVHLYEVTTREFRIIDK